MNRSESDRKYREKHHDKIVAQVREDRLLNPSKYREYDRRKYLKHSNRIKQVRRLYYEKNRLDTLQKNAEYRQKNKDKIRIIQRAWYAKQQGNLHYKIRCNLKNRIWSVVKRGNKSGRTIELLGCSISDFAIYLESRFKVGMTWGNYGSKWHIDHIVPCALFDLSKSEHQKSCFHFSNMRPMWAVQNVKRGHRGHHQMTMDAEMFPKREVL